jgi:hypothetical protein
MKKIRYKIVSIIAILAFAWSCNDLDIQPVNILNDSQVYTNAAGINAAIQSMYMQLPIPGFSSSFNNIRVGGAAHLNFENMSLFTGECQRIPLRANTMGYQLQGSYYSWWDYTAIRYCNIGIQQLKINADKFITDKVKFNHWLGEAYFCRAYMYYAMVRSFGGVPIVKKPDTYLNYSDFKELEIPRNTEKEVVDFIASDLDSAMMLMGANELESGRANKFMAANMKARAMLFAACESRFAQVQLNGLVGIPASESKNYYKKAYAAANFATNNGGKYKLYRKYDDGTYMGKVKNFEQIFIDETSANTERMLIIRHDPSINNAHCWDANQRPKGYTQMNDPNCELSATLEFVELFEDVDGNPGKLNIGDPANPVRYAKPADLWVKSQPRLRASVLLAGVPFPGSNDPTDIFELRRGIYEAYPNGKLWTSTNWTDKFNGMTIQGKCGIGNVQTTDNGFVVWKYQNPSGTGAYWSSFQDLIEMRYAEVLLNKAEAAINIIGETVDGNTITMQDALDPINDIRSRAGETSLSSVNEAKIITERRCELFCENLIMWDMKRWRMLEEVVQNKTFNALYPYYIWDEKKYIFLKSERTAIKYTVDPKNYYAPIPASAIQKNPKLLPNNPGY